MSYEPERSKSSSNTWLILLVVGILGIFGCGILGVVILAAITAIGTTAEAKFQTVGSSLSGGPATGASVEPVDAGVRQVLDMQMAAWNKGDLEGFMQGYWRSEDLTFFSDDKPKHGWDETYARYKKRYQGEGKEMGKLSFSELQIEAVGSDRALVRGRWKVEFQKGENEGLFTLLMRKFPDGWRITHDHTSSRPEKP